MEREHTISDVVEWILRHMDDIEDIVVVTTKPAEEFGEFITSVESNTNDFYRQLGMLEHAKEVMMYGDDDGKEVKY